VARSEVTGARFAREYDRSVGSMDCAVVIPAWNCERYIGEAIESVVAQTSPATTIIVVDDGSTDATADVAREWSQVRVITQEHAGAGSARNRGVAACDEPVLAFLDADDVWLPDKLERQLPLLDESGYHAAFGLVTNFISPDRDDLVGSVEYERRALPGFIPSALVVRRDEWDRVGQFDTATLGDWVDWYVRLVDSGARIGVVDHLVVRRRIHGDNQTMRDGQQHSAYLGQVKASIDRRRARTTTQPIHG
jgi:glycosyltransferase involved in cell wall biosynthesis